MENKTYYDWLEVSKKASPEVIEKAYKALIIKYHPDLQQENKQNSEEIIKKINEAYSVLSDSSKRAQYDASLQARALEQKQQQSKSDYNIKQQQTYDAQDYKTQNIDYQKQVDAARRQAYHDAYIQDLKNRGYKIRYKKSFKDYVKIAITIFIIFLVFWIIWQIPFVRNWINSLADNNFVIRIIVDVIRSIYEALFETFF
ncbi:MAG: J domain-containing protein [Clostridia bacterium]|nr:J domain-containing protein [Clostridia bacterium]